MELEKHVEALSARASTFKITNNEQFVVAGALRAAIKDLRVKIAESYDPIIAKAYQAHKEAVKQKKLQDDPLEQGERYLKQEMIGLTDQQERSRRLEQAKADLEAKKRAEDEALELAETLEAAGATEAAQEVLVTPIEAAAPILPKLTPKISGFSSRTIYTTEVVDRKAFLAAVASGHIPDLAWMPDYRFLDKQAAALKETMVWPGVVVTSRKV